jgi:pyruvate formate lyase activating enzyme
MQIGGFVDISTKDIPNLPCMVIFTVGCNLNCEFCHNKYLHDQSVGKQLTVEKIISLVKSNQLVNGISITGGEPTLQEDLIELCQEIKKVGKYLSVDTNGTHPHIIRQLVNHVDRIALDLKAPLKKKRLKQICNQEIDPEPIKEAFKLINEKSEIDFEVRTTYVEGLMQTSDIQNIISFLKKYKFRGNFVLQQYQYSEGVGERYKNIFKKPEHGVLLELLQPYKDSKLSFHIYLRDEIVGYSSIDKLYNISINDVL